MKRPIKICSYSELHDRQPFHALVNGLDLVVIRYEKQVSIFYGRCLHRGALMSDGHIEGNNLICGVHGWDYRLYTGVSEYNNEEALYKFSTRIDGNTVFADEAEILDFLEAHPQPFDRTQYLGEYVDTHPENTEPYTLYIRELARHGLKNTGPHGFSSAMGVDRNLLPKWEDIQFLPAQLASRPMLDEQSVSTSVVIGSGARKPLELALPVFVSDMSFGALSREAKISLSKGAELAGTGICSGEGGMLPEEQENNSMYFYEFASGQFGFSWDKVIKAQAFHFKAGQWAKT